jgi:hypothetical protein
LKDIQDIEAIFLGFQVWFSSRRRHGEGKAWIEYFVLSKIMLVGEKMFQIVEYGMQHVPPC